MTLYDVTSLYVMVYEMTWFDVILFFYIVYMNYMMFI